MDFRPASMEDLPQLKSVYRQIVRNMDENQIQIWDDIYPCEFFQEDIRKKRFYLLLEGTEIVSGFALCDFNAGEGSVDWENSHGKALYLDRLGVNTDYRGKGVGSLMLERAGETARALGAKYLRLFVVDINVPAIRLYEKNGFTRAQGVYEEVIDEELVLREYGYERRV